MKSQLNANDYQNIIQSFKNLPPILTIGDVGIDQYTFGDVKRISPEAPVPILEVEKKWYKLGLAANVAENISSLSGQCHLFGLIGDDYYGNLFESLLEEKKLTTWGLVRDKNRQTTVKERVVTSVQQIVRIDYESSKNMLDDVKDRLINRLEEFIPKQGAIILEDYGKGIFGPETTQSIIKLAIKSSKKVYIDPSRYSDPKWYMGASLLKPNWAEALELSQKLGGQYTDPHDVNKFLSHELNIPQIVTTKGAEGIFYYAAENNLSKHLPTVKVEVFDVSGAGDTTIAMLTLAQLANASLEQSCFLANCASGVVVGKKGTASVTLEELTDFYQSHYH